MIKLFNKLQKFILKIQFKTSINRLEKLLYSYYKVYHKIEDFLKYDKIHEYDASLKLIPGSTNKSLLLSLNLD